MPFEDLARRWPAGYLDDQEAGADHGELARIAGGDPQPAFPGAQLALDPLHGVPVQAADRAVGQVLQDEHGAFGHFGTGEHRQVGRRVQVEHRSGVPQPTAQHAEQRRTLAISARSLQDDERLIADPRPQRADFRGLDERFDQLFGSYPARPDLGTAPPERELELLADDHVSGDLIVREIREGATEHGVRIGPALPADLGRHVRNLPFRGTGSRWIRRPGIAGGAGRRRGASAWRVSSRRRRGRPGWTRARRDRLGSPWVRTGTHRPPSRSRRSEPWLCCSPMTTSPWNWLPMSVVPWNSPPETLIPPLPSPSSPPGEGRAAELALARWRPGSSSGSSPGGELRPGTLIHAKSAKLFTSARTSR